MKFKTGFLLLYLLCSVAKAAAPLSSANDNFSSDITNLNYYPHQGRFDANVRTTSSLIDNTSSTAGTSQTVNLSQYYASVSYGVAQGLRLALNDTFLWDQSTDALSATQTETTTTSAGLSNPVITLTYRWLESRSRFSGDIGFNVNPPIGQKVSAEGADGATGNNYSGGWVGQVSAGFYWRDGFNEVELAGSGTRNFYTESRGAAGAIAATEPYWIPTATLTDRIHFTERHFLQASVEYTFANSHDAVAATGISTVTNTDSSTTPTLQFGYSPETNTVFELSGILRKGSSTAAKIAADGTPAAPTFASSTVLTATLGFLHQF